MLGLKWDAIDFERGTLTIKRTVTSVNVGGKTQIIEQESAKTKSSMRTLPLVGRFKEYFAEVKAAQELNKQVCGNCYNYEYDGFVFVDELGERMRPDYLTSQFPAFIQRHGMKKMRFHDLRHPYVKPTTKKIFIFSCPHVPAFLIGILPPPVSVRRQKTHEVAPFLPAAYTQKLCRLFCNKTQSA